MFYLIGLGLSEKGLSIEALEILKKCKKVYVENYTSEFPYPIHRLEDKIGKPISSLTRMMVEAEKFVEEAKKINIAMLVYGSPLAATTHISLILKCKNENIPYQVIHNTSIFDAVSETGLQIYKFGKTASMPAWNEKYKPDSFVKLIKYNRKMGAHTLILVDIGLTFHQALKQLEEALKGQVKVGKIVVCSRLGTNESRIFYDTMDELVGKEVYAPFCIIIPEKLHFLEEEALEKLK